MCYVSVGVISALATYIHTCIHTYIHTYRHTDIQTYIHTDIHTDIQTYIHTDIHTYIHTYIQTYIQAYIHTYIHTYIQTYIHTCIHTYIHTYTTPTHPHAYMGRTRQMTYRHEHTSKPAYSSPLFPPFTAVHQTEVDKLVSSHMRKEERASWSWWGWGRRSSSIPAKMNEVGHWAVT